MKEFSSINDILDFAINNEQSAVDFYNSLALNARNDDMKKVFEGFAREEMGHKAFLMKVKEEGAYQLSVEKIADLKIADYTVKAPSDIKNITYEEALVLAMNREKNTFKLYKKLSERAPNSELRNIFLNLAQEESKHKLRFELEYDEYVLREN